MSPMRCSCPNCGAPTKPLAPTDTELEYDASLDPELNWSRIRVARLRDAMERIYGTVNLTLAEAREIAHRALAETDGGYGEEPQK